MIGKSETVVTDRMTKEHGFIVLRLLAVSAIGILAVWLTGLLFSLTYPFIIAAVLVWMFHPLIRFFRKMLRMPNMLAVFLTVLLGLSAVIGSITGIIALIVFGFRRISAFLPEWIQTTAIQAQDFFNQSIFPLWQQFSGAVDSLTPEQQTTLQNGIERLGTQLAEGSTNIGQGMADGLASVIIFVPSFLIVFLFVFIAFYFIGKDWDRMFSKAYEITPAFILKKARAFKTMFQYRVFGFVRAQLILMFIASIVVLIGLLILRVEHALTIAMIVGIAEILPYLGSGTILIPWFVYMLLTGEISMGIGLAVVYGVTVGIRQSIEPKVLSSSMNLNALGVLISLFVGFQLFGVVGVFVGPFILVILVIFKDIGVLSEIGRFIRWGFKDEPDPGISGFK
ncbi:sporulation integral membrane protein YtvI [[Bacillus] selenitireducens MLS10]|uniref:Sporulation integral membrane protein YtvI n=2 Tax=Salisediminibacterium selenitireducens TaxID=85683 RepID=D6XYL2_BACIE|nr:sporulation integral membrane protein YtvI [[Bacillus] selenitireducens MLS10]